MINSKKTLVGLDACFRFGTEWEEGRRLENIRNFLFLKPDNDYKDQGDHHHGWWRERRSNKH